MSDSDQVLYLLRNYYDSLLILSINKIFVNDYSPR